MHGVACFALRSEKLSGKDSFGKEVHKFLGDNDNHENTEHPMHGAVFPGLGSEKLSSLVTVSV